MQIKKDLMYFEIYDEIYSLQDYKKGIEEHCGNLANEVRNALLEFPETIRGVKQSIGEYKNIPVFIIYNGHKESIFEFVQENMDFESKLSLLQGLNGLEVYNESDILRHILFEGDKNGYFYVLIETLRVLQDLSNMFATARMALLEAHRKLHFTKAVSWKNGKEQLWLRAAWLNNSIVLYDSCFDKVLQAIWIGSSDFTKQSKCPLHYEDLTNLDNLDKIYRECYRRRSLNRIPEEYQNKIISFADSKLKKVSNYSQMIKHRGGMRYRHLFYLSDISRSNNKLDSSEKSCLQELYEIDQVVNDVEEYHKNFISLVNDIWLLLADNFKKNGYNLKSSKANWLSRELNIKSFVG